MSEKKEHPQAKWLRAIADGETLQNISLCDDTWYDLGGCDVLSLIARDNLNTGCLRIKPRTITIGKYEVAEPMREAPERGVRYFYLDPMCDGGATSLLWENDSTDQTVVSTGMCWLKREDAELAAKAITELLTGKSA